MRWAVCLLLHHRRLLAAAQGRLAQALFDETTPATDIVTLLEEETLRVQAALRTTTAGRLQWASGLLPQVLADAEARRLQREATGSAVLGVPTGLAQLDNLLGGLNEGLYLLAGAPGMGKTTLALQIAATATPDFPVVAVPFHHAAAPDGALPGRGGLSAVVGQGRRGPPRKFLRPRARGHVGGPAP